MSVEFDVVVGEFEPMIPEIPRAVLDESVIRHVMWLFGRRGGRQPGSCEEHILSAFAIADPQMFGRLEAGFEVHGFWMRAFREDPNALTLAVRALDILGVKAIQS